MLGGGGNLFFGAYNFFHFLAQDTSWDTSFGKIGPIRVESQKKFSRIF